MIGSVHNAVAFQLFQGQAKHPLRNTKIALELIEPQHSVFSQRDHHKHAPPVTNTRQHFVDAFAIGALFVVQHGGSLLVTEVQKCAFLWRNLVPIR